MINILNRLAIKFLLHSPLNLWLGKVFFSNNGGLISNCIGRHIKRRDSRKAKKLGFRSEYNAIAEALKEEGFYKSNEIYNYHTINEITKIWDEYANSFQPPEDGRFQLSSADQSKELKFFIPLLEKLISEDIKETLESYFNSYFRIINYHIYRNRRPPLMDEINSYGATANWHNDRSTSESIKLFFMLSDVEKQNGPMQIISKEESQKVIKSNNFYYPDSEGKTKEYIKNNCKTISLEGKAGTLFYAMTNDALHRATVPDAGRYRDLIVFYITSSSINRSVNQQLKEAKYREILGLKRFFIN
tara:strand:- start:4988 stop:5893 length:906 start_codon:yes stop_codon:yes gene_type:complete